MTPRTAFLAIFCAAVGWWLSRSLYLRHGRVLGRVDDHQPMSENTLRGTGSGTGDIALTVLSYSKHTCLFLQVVDQTWASFFRHRAYLTDNLGDESCIPPSVRDRLVPVPDTEKDVITRELTGIGVAIDRWLLSGDSRWLAVGDDDTLFVGEHLERALHHFDSSLPLVLTALDSGIWGGSGFVLSRQAAVQLRPFLGSLGAPGGKCRELCRSDVRSDTWGDVCMFQCLTKLAKIPRTTRLAHNGPQLMFSQRPEYYWTRPVEKTLERAVPRPDSVVSMHYLQPHEMLALWDNTTVFGSTRDAAPGQDDAALRDMVRATDWGPRSRNDLLALAQGMV